MLVEPRWSRRRRLAARPGSCAIRRENAWKGGCSDHEDVKTAHNNAQFRSIAGHAGGANRHRCLKARSVRAPDSSAPQPPGAWPAGPI